MIIRTNWEKKYVYKSMNSKEDLMKLYPEEQKKNEQESYSYEYEE